MSDTKDWNSYTNTGVYYFDAKAAEAPNAAGLGYPYGVMHVFRANSRVMMQMAFTHQAYSGTNAMFRVYFNFGSASPWSSWREFS